MKNILINLCLMALIIYPITATANDEQPAEYTAEGLKLVHDIAGIDLVWVKPGVDLPQYRHFYLVEPYVAFRKNWQKDQNRGHPTLRVKASDMEEIKSDMAELITQVFTEELLASGLTFSEVRAEGVMIIKPAILDLDLNAPDIQSSGTSDILAASAGSMKLYLEVYDSVSEQLLAKAVDQAFDTNTGHMQSQKKVANRAAARRMMMPLAKALGSGFTASTETAPKDREAVDSEAGQNR